MHILEIDRWVTPATSYPRTTVGSATIGSHYYTKGLYHAYMTGPPGGPEYDYWRAKKRLIITHLKINGKVWMVDDVPHWYAMQDHATHYHGRVLVAGLGLGLIVHTLMTNPKVTEIVVVDHSPDVIQLIQPLVPQLREAQDDQPACTLRVVQADWYEWEPDCQPDGVFYDLFVGSMDVRHMAMAIREMLHLKQRFLTATVFRIHGFGNDYLNQLTDTIRAAPLVYQVAKRTIGAHRRYPYRAVIQDQSREFAVENTVKGKPTGIVQDAVVMELLARAIGTKHGQAESTEHQVRLILRPTPHAVS